MPGVNTGAGTRNDLARRAKTRLRELTAKRSDDFAGASPKDMRAMRHELLVHQIELEMQNEALREAEAETANACERYRDLYDGAATGYCTLSVNGCILEANLTLARLLGCERDQLAGKAFTQLVAGDAQDDFYLARKNMVQAGKAHSFELRMRRADGSLFWARIDWVVTSSGAGDVTARLSIADVSDQRISRQRIEDIIEGTGAGTWEWDIATDATVFSDRWITLLGQDPDDPTPRTRAAFKQLVHPEDRAAAGAALERHLRGETRMYESEIRMRHSDGRWIWILERGRVWRRMHDGSPVMMSGTHMDVTGRKLAAEALEVAMRRAEEAALAKSRFLATMSHEIRTPLNGVLGMAALLDREIKDPNQRAMLTVIRQSGETLLNLINDVLDLTKIESGRFDFEAVPFAPADLARQIVAAHGPKAAERGLDLRIEAGAEAERPRCGDPHRLMQVLHNLVGNAVKFTEAGSVTVSVGAEPDLAVAFEVSDTGIGMTAETLSHVFEPFTQADSSTTRRYGGTGLGMSIVRRIVEAMGGGVSIKSWPGEGTCVRVVAPLPLVEADDTVVLTPSEEGGVAGLRVLAADDNDINRMVLKAMLEALDVTVTMVEGGAQAVAAAAGDTTYDVILLDITMRGIDGCEALALIRADERERRRPTAPAIAVTAHALEEHAKTYLAAGFMGHLPKPLSLAALAAHLRAAAAAAAAAPED